ncbi:MAG: isocitrate lyase/phosphoenolpyruvate mutase family protein [Acidobacteriia bacterium]|nr:isocitrate lyase/phosphoenolpyruvate mutase family protein [Terriglobia bacterium]
MEPLAAKAARFREMHHGPRILVLPNAWDAASARIFEQAGFQALATTSAGIAASLGYPDGERVGRDEMLAVVRRIVQAVSVPVTADLESGYGASTADVEATARGAIAAGAVGLNLEDARARILLEMAQAVERIRAVRRVADEAGVPLVINARIDVLLRQAGPPETRVEETIRRANAYRDAGADCLFVPAALDAETIGRLVGAIRGPVNILALPGVPSISELERLGVARVSTGSGPMRATMTLTRRIAEELKQGEFRAITEAITTYAEVNRRME